MAHVTCQGVDRSTAACKLSRAAKGKPIQLRGPCATCGERRCRTHCRCGRRGDAKGRNAGRPDAHAARVATKAAAKAKASTEAAKAKAAARASPAPVAPQPAELSADVLTGQTYQQRLLADFRGAREIWLATLVFDSVALTEALLLRLADNCSVVILVDAEYHRQGTSRGQRSRLSQLQRAGAEVYLCRGTQATGSLHLKAVVVDGAVAYVGSANFTEKSERNAEAVTRLEGPPVATVSSLLASERARGLTWSGK